MEKGVRAFFYDYKYYLIPDDVSSVKELKSRSSIATKRLKEELCMAPDFIYESIVDETVEIDDGNRIFEVFVNLYSHEEYDAILREQVDRVCRGCEYYDNEDDPSLNGHHREIALTGTCYIRQDKNAKYDYSDLFDWYWRETSNRLNELAECIDKNDQIKLNKILNENLTKFFYETEFVGAVIDGKYTLCIANSWGTPSSLMCLYDIIASAAQGENSPIKKSDWAVLPYIPSGSSNGSRADPKTPMLRLKSLDSDGEPPFVVEVYQPNADKLDDDETSKLLAELYNGFVYALGEPMLFKTLCEFSLTSNGADLITIEQAAERIKSFFAGLVKNGGNDGNSYPPEQGFRAGSERAEISLPFRQNLNEGVTKCADMSCLVEDADVNICWWKAMASFAYLVVPGQMDDIELPMSVLSRYFSEMSNVPVPIRDPDDSRMVGTMIGIGDCGEDGYLVDYIIVSEKAFFRKLRILAPVLKAYGAKVVIVNKDGIAAYDCDYEFTQCQP